MRELNIKGKERIRQQTETRKEVIKKVIDTRTGKAKKTGDDIKEKRFGLMTRIDKVAQTIEDAKTFGRERIKTREKMLTK